MGCCCRIQSEQLVGNLFHYLCKSDIKITKDLLDEFYAYLQERFYTYVVTTDISNSQLEYLAEKYPTLFVYHDSDKDGVYLSSTGNRPSLDYFNACYSFANASYLSRLTKSFISDKLKVEVD